MVLGGRLVTSQRYHNVSRLGKVRHTLLSGSDAYREFIGKQTLFDRHVHVKLSGVVRVESKMLPADCSVLIIHTADMLPLVDRVYFDSLVNQDGRRIAVNAEGGTFEEAVGVDIDGHELRLEPRSPAHGE